MPEIQLDDPSTATAAPEGLEPLHSTTSVTLSNGKIISIVPDRALDNLLVYETSADRTTTTLRKTIAKAAPYSFKILMMGSQANNDFWISYVSVNRLKAYACKVTYSTFAVSAWEEIVIGNGFSVYASDMEVTDANMVLVAFVIDNGKGDTYRYIMGRGTNNTWKNVLSQSIGSVGATAFRRGGAAMAIASLGAASGNRDVVMAFAATTVKEDSGVVVQTMRITETTATLVANTLAGRATYMDGDASRSAGSYYGRLLKIYRTGTSEFVLGIAHREQKKRCGAIKATLVGTTFNIVSPLTVFAVPSAGSYMAMACNGKVLNFYYATNTAGETSSVFAVTADLRGSSIAISGNPDWRIGMARYSAAREMGSQGNRNLALSQLDVTIRSFQDTAGSYPTATNLLYAKVPKPASGNPITSISPANNSQLTTANPALLAEVDFDLKRGQTLYKIQFQFATDQNFTNNLIDYVQPNSKFKTVDSTDASNYRVIFTDALPTNFSLTGLLWYYRARIVDFWGNVSDWTAANRTSLGHAPYPEYVSPRSGQLLPWNGGNVTFDWRFMDSSATDYQTAYQVSAFLSSDDSTIFNTGKIAGAVKSYSYTLPSSVKDKQIYWRVSLWDSDDTQSLSQESSYFTVTDPPSVTIVSPNSSGTVTTGVPSFVFTMNNGGSRQLKEYTVSVMQNGVVIWSKRVAGPFNPGTTVSEKIPQGYLNNNQNYTLQVTTVDILNLNASSALTPFSVSWVPPSGAAGVLVDVESYNTEDEGYVAVIWDDTARDPDFISWTVLRKDDMLNPDTGEVVEEGFFREVFYEYEIGTGYEFKDFFAPASYKVTYIIRQAINRDGQDMTSSNIDSYSVIPRSDGYWLIEPDSDNADADAFKLSIVTGDSFADEQEESELNVIGRGRTVNKGENFGVKGTLDASIRSNGGSTARQKRIRLREVQKVDGQLWLRNPFGDSFKVSVGAMSISRIAGTGESEFCDVTIPYSEVF